MLLTEDHLRTPTILTSQEALHPDASLMRAALAPIKSLNWLRMVLKANAFGLCLLRVKLHIVIHNL